MTDLGWLYWLYRKDGNLSYQCRELGNPVNFNLPVTETLAAYVAAFLWLKPS